MTIFVALLFMGIFASVASLFLKKATSNGLNFKKIVVCPYLYLGGGLYVFSALLNIYLLKRFPYSVVVPIGSLSYVWTLVIAHKFLNEIIVKRKIIGVFLILIGIGTIIGT